MTILPDVLVTNEPARVDCGAPDYVLTRKDVPIGYIEAKDIGVDLKDKKLKEQFDRYKSGLTNLIITDYMDFHFYKDGEFVTKIAIASSSSPSKGGEIVPIPENFDQFICLIQNFALTVSQTIKSPTKLAQMMAGKAKLMADVIEKSLNYDDQQGIRSSIKSQMLSFQQMLIHDIDNKSFADIYSQTIAYGMFAARYHDPTLENFSREEAATLIPKSNPFLRKLFQDIAGYDLDTRLDWIVEELVTIFLASDVATIMKNFGKSTKQEDPVVHFYETFLGEYNPALRKARGVWYTPQPVVNFIVRAVDDILKTEFNLPQGLADTSKIKIKKKAVTQTKGVNPKIVEVETEVEVHRVQILDPATGTGTFLAEVVKHIYKKFEGQQGIWSKYVTNDLIPRLNGFELLMASYAMAHLKMDMLLTETGYKPTDDQRFRIFLTNSLEEAHPDTQTLFSSWLSDEADQANAIKRDAPVMVVIGNPPYSVSSTNKSPWIEKLTADYKKDMKERNIQPLSDDYIKFIRFGQHFIDKNGSGILAYISNNSFIDGIIHRQMRKHLLESFDKIYILDLHGNTRIKEFSLDGSVDQNVFDIMAGVSINIFVKTNKKEKKSIGNVLHYDLFGKRDLKYSFLSENDLNTIKWNNLDITAPEYLMVNKDYSAKSVYNLGFSINDLFINNNSGLATEFDELVIHNDYKSAEIILNELKTLNAVEIKSKYSFKDKQLIKIENAKKDIEKNKVNIYPINYRPFDKQYCIYTGLSNGIMGRPRNSTMQHFIKGKNVGIIVSRTVYGSCDWYDIQITTSITEKGIMAMRVGNAAIVCPLYLYPETTAQQSLSGLQTLTGLGLENEKPSRTPNLNPEIVKQIADGLGIAFVAEKETVTNETFANVSNFGKGAVKLKNFAPIDLLDYIYAVLHSPTYREKYKEFLKIDFPRVPYPESLSRFETLTKLGGELRQIHLLESPVVEKYITQYPEDGDNVVGKPTFVKVQNFDKANIGDVYINETQYFANVPEVAWNFYIGGYQPAQKWLKDRKERELSYEDILHYQKIIVALSETSRIMKEIKQIEI
jgi:predicted helicase